MKAVFETPTHASMIHLGHLLGAESKAGFVLAFHGDLGAGKTTLAKGVALGLDIPSVVISPTFNLVNIYEEGRLSLYHADFYRLSSEEELDILGLDEGRSGVIIAEWASLFPDALQRDHLSVQIEVVEPGRVVHCEAFGPVSVGILAQVAARWAAGVHE